MNAPTRLQHKPIIAVDDYDENDAQFANDTDAMALSIGIAQYDDFNDENNKDISLKVWRHTGKKWNRQSEELPIHRCIDLNILFVDSLLYAIKNKSLTGTIVDKNKVKDIARYYKANERHLKPRLIELKKRLTDFLENN